MKQKLATFLLTLCMAATVTAVPSSIPIISTTVPVLAGTGTALTDDEWYGDFYGQGYLVPAAAERYLVLDDLLMFNPQLMKYAKNEIYARHGYIFKSPELQGYFETQSWYHGTTPGDSFDESVFNEYERANIDYIVQQADLLSSQYTLDQPGYSYEWVYRMVDKKMGWSADNPTATTNAASTAATPTETTEADTIISGNLQGNEVTQTLNYTRKADGTYRLEDEHFIVCDNHGEVTNYDALDQLTPITWQDGEAPDPSAVDALANLERVYQFYDECFHSFDDYALDPNTKGPDGKVPIIINTLDTPGKDKDGNEVENRVTTARTRNHCILLGREQENPASYAKQLDIMAHEFTHFRSIRVIDSINGFEITSIVEGLADIMGSLAEDYLDDKRFNNTNNYELGRTGSALELSNLDPTYPDYQSYMAAEKKFKADGVGIDKTLQTAGEKMLDYVYYRLRQGMDEGNEYKIGNAKLSALYYDTMMYRLVEGMTLKQFRTAFEHEMYDPKGSGTDVVDKHPLTDKQKECVIDAYDSVGIPSEIPYLVEATGQISLRDAKTKLKLKNATLTVTHPDGSAIKNATNLDLPDGVWYPDEYDLPHGIYKGLVTDETGSKQFSFDFIVNDQREDSLLTYQPDCNVWVNYVTMTASSCIVSDGQDTYVIPGYSDETGLTDLSTVPGIVVKYDYVSAVAFYGKWVIYCDKEAGTYGVWRRLVIAERDDPDTAITLHEGSDDSDTWDIYRFAVQNNVLYGEITEGKTAVNKQRYWSYSLLDWTVKEDVEPSREVMNLLNGSCYAGGWEYYQMDADNDYLADEIHRLDPDGKTDEIVVTDDTALELEAVIGNTLYYSTMDTETNPGQMILWTKDLETGEVTELARHDGVGGGMYFNW